VTGGALAAVSAILGVALLAIALVFFQASPGAGPPSQRQDVSATPGSAPPAVPLWVEVLKALAPIFAAVVVGIFGTLVAQWYTREQAERDRQERVLQAERDSQARHSELNMLKLQTVERFLPYLSSKTEAEKRVAILSIQALGDTDLAAELGGLLSSTGTVQALEAIARQSEPTQRRPALAALASIGTAEAEQALARVFETASKALIKVVAESLSDTRSEPGVVAGVLFSSRDFVALLTYGYQNPRPPADIPFIEQRGKSDALDNLVYVHVEDDPVPETYGRVSFAATPAKIGDQVIAVGLTSDGAIAPPQVGKVIAIVDKYLEVRFAFPLRHLVGSLLLSPAGDAVGLLKNDDSETTTYRYVRGDLIQQWLQLL